MNRIVLIGNGFDLAHGLKSSYKDFIEWYWEQRVLSFIDNRTTLSQDPLFSIKSNAQTFNQIAIFESVGVLNKENRINLLKGIEKDTHNYKIKYTAFYKGIRNCIEKKGWVDIEYEYYKRLKECCFSKPQLLYAEDNIPEILESLNKQLHFLETKLTEYLNSICNDISEPNSEIKKLIYEPATPRDISVEGISAIIEKLKDDMDPNNVLYKHEVENRIRRSGYEISDFDDSRYYRKLFRTRKFFSSDKPCPYFFPENILLLNFNYTNTVSHYFEKDISHITNIHGTLNDPDSIIFGYGDELDEKFKDIKELEHEESRRNIKSIKYLESDNYRTILSFIESAPYQIHIMGHSCGNSDRTLINTLFEHKNCISIKPFYHQKEDGTDNFFELAQNISKNFTDMKLMRDRVVNKTYCKPLPQNDTLFH